MKDTENIEKLAELEHQQWMYWSEAVAKKLPQSAQSAHIIKGWMENWKPYAELSDEVKEFDRVWARKVIPIIEDALRLQREEFLKKIDAIIPDVLPLQAPRGYTTESVIKAIKELKKELKQQIRGE